MPDGERRLAAIMYTDMIGYTALGQRNESLSLTLVKEQRKLIRPILTRHNGREIKTMGDAFLVEFPNALDAVRCAYDIQRATREFNISLPEEKRIHLRVGLHLGDVVESGGDISGDAVNVASRIEPLAEDGGVCLTRQVYESTHNKLEMSMSSMGMKSLKNVSEPMEVYKMMMPWEKENAEPAPQLDPRRVAVLPFVSMSPDPNDEYFADGLTEELITRVSLVKGLEVIARTSAMNYKKEKKNASQIGRELKVGTLLEGSVRKAGNRIRVSAQLINANTEGHLWAETYDRNLDDVFGIQSDIASRVADSLSAGVLSNIQRKDTDDIEAYTTYLRAMQLLHEHTDPSMRKAVTLFESAISNDPKFARAYAGLAMAWTTLGGWGYEDFTVAVGRAEAAARRAVELGPECAEAHIAMATVCSRLDRFEEAEKEAEVALSLNPNLSDAYHRLGVLQGDRGRLEKAEEYFARALELDPLSFGDMNLLLVLFEDDGKMDRAWNILERLKQIYPTNPRTFSALAKWYWLRKDFVNAQGSLDIGFRISPEDRDLRTEQGQLYALTNRREDAEKQLSLLKSDPRESVRLNGELYIQTALGTYDEAFKALMRMAEIHTWTWNMKTDPSFAELRKDPRFAKFCKKVGIPP